MLVYLNTNLKVSVAFLTIGVTLSEVCLLVFRTEV